MKNLIGKQVLVTTAAWFFAPDGKEYRAAWGLLHSLNTTEETLGFKPNARHTNWFIQVGNLTIAGCQVQYLVQTNEVNIGTVKDFTQERTHECLGDFSAEEFTRPSKIYHAE